MRQRIYIWIAVAIVLLLVFSCKTRYVPVEIKTTETVEVHDTTITERLVPYKDSTATRDTVSFLSNPYAYSWARYSGGMLQTFAGNMAKFGTYSNSTSLYDGNQANRST